MTISKQSWYKIASAIAACIVAIAGALCCSSCSTTKATIYSPKDSAYTQVTITTNNPVSADTKVDANADATINP